jgi:hypothetical protein
LRLYLQLLLQAIVDSCPRAETGDFYLTGHPQRAPKLDQLTLQ